jgi:AmmeMemoRadiSam system protein A
LETTTLPHDYLLAVARAAIQKHLSNENLNAAQQQEQSKPVFVTLYARDTNRLRGCIGHLRAAEDTLEKEVQVCAIASATKDPRMSSVTLDELPMLRIEISILGDEEEVSSVDELDPTVWGITVRKERRVGVLLPDIEGIDSPQAQIQIALKKGNISPDEAFLISRFQVRKYREP